MEVDNGSCCFHSATYGSFGSSFFCFTIWCGYNFGIGYIFAQNYYTEIIKNNIVDETDISNNGIYAGLALIQPYGKRTKSFKNVTIKFENNKYPKNEQLYYFYAGSNDTPMTNKTKPRIYVNGSLQVN